MFIFIENRNIQQINFMWFRHTNIGYETRIRACFTDIHTTGLEIESM
jgi:hypothetical protein